MYVVVFFLLLWTLFQVVLSHISSCEIVEPRTRNYGVYSHNLWNLIYLIEPEGSKIHMQLNTKFIREYKSVLGDEPLNIAYLKCDSHKVLDIIKTQLIRSLSYEYVIYLNAIDFYRTNYNEVKESGFLWAGDMNNHSKPFEVCKSNDKTRVWKSETVTECESSYETIKAAKVVSEKVSEKSFLMDFVNKFDNTDYHPYKHLPTHYMVLICSDTNGELRDEPAGINTIIQYRFDCSIQNEVQVIAIIAPNSAGIEETSKPVIFFDQDTSQAEAGFPNAIYQKPRSYKNLAEQFLWFIWEMGWRRVAVISDSTKESIEFEKHLKSKFKVAASWLSYTTREVVETSHGYDFTQALDSLKHAEARIIIVNVAEEHAPTLARDARTLAMSQLTVWVAREWSERTVKNTIKKMFTVYSLVTNTKREPHASIDAINNTITENYRINDRLENVFLDHKRFASNVNRYLRWNHQKIPKIHIYLSNPRRHYDLIAVDKQWNGEFQKIERPMDRFTVCTLKTLNFDRHCDDMVLIYILLVIAVFAITVLGITYFFTSPPDTPYDRMRN